MENVSGRTSVLKKATTLIICMMLMMAFCFNIFADEQSPNPGRPTIECADGIHEFRQDQYNFIKGFWEYTGDWQAMACKHTFQELLLVCQVEGHIEPDEEQWGDTPREPAIYYVRFGYYDENNEFHLLKKETVARNTSATPPTNVPTVNGKTCVGWLGDYTCVTSAFTYIARYDENASDYTIYCSDGPHTFRPDQYNFIRGFWTYTGDWQAMAHKHTYEELLLVCEVEGHIKREDGQSPKPDNSLKEDDKLSRAEKESDDEEKKETSSSSSSYISSINVQAVNTNSTETVAKETNVLTYVPTGKETVSKSININPNGTSTLVAVHKDGTVAETTSLPVTAVALNSLSNINQMAPTIVNTVSLVVDKSNSTTNAQTTKVTTVVDAKTINGNVSLTPQMVSTLKNAASDQIGKSTNNTNVDIKINTTAADGKPLSVVVSSKDLKANSTLKAYVMDPVLGGYIMVDVPTVKYDRNKGLTTSGLVSGLEYHFVSAGEAKKIEANIANSIKISDEYSKPVATAPGSILDMSKAISSGFNMANATKVEYLVSGNQATINPITGQLIVKGNAKGTITVSINVTLRSGKKKTIKARLNVA